MSREHGLAATVEMSGRSCRTQAYNMTNELPVIKIPTSWKGTECPKADSCPRYPF